MSNFNDVSEKEMQDMLKFLDSLDDENNDVKLQDAAPPSFGLNKGKS